jgi:hypothetical protein
VPELPRGAIVALTGDSDCGKSTLATAWCRDAFRNKGVPFVFLDRENPKQVVIDRIRRLGLESGQCRTFWGGWLKEEAPQPDDPRVRTWAKERKGIVVVDSFSAFLDGDQNGVLRLPMPDFLYSPLLLAGAARQSAPFRGARRGELSVAPVCRSSPKGTGELANSTESEGYWCG